MRKIVWKKWVNPIKYINQQGEESENSNILLQHTPFGVMPVKLNAELYQNKNIFIGHTNFDIDEDIKYIIEETPGVESLEVFSPYRFKIVVGTAFHNKRVLRDIKTRLCNDNIGYDFSIEDSNDIYKHTLELRKNSKPWFIYILPNGKYESFTFNNEDDLENKIKEYSDIRDIIGGVILTE